MTAIDERVCPRCGERAGEQRFCASCGLNLAQQPELPASEEYQARLREEQWLRKAGAASPLASAAPTQDGEAAAQSAAVQAQALPLAGWWIRAGAIVIDGLILLLPSVILTLLFGFIIGAFLYLGVLFAYYLLMTRKSVENGQSWGMQAVGIRVRREDGAPIDIQTVVIRQLLMQGIVFGLLGIFIIPPLLDYLWPIWDSENRCLHDMVAKTRVVRI